MDILFEWIGPPTVTTRAIVGFVILAAILAALVGLTRLVVSWRTALLSWAVLIAAGVLALLYAPVSVDVPAAAADRAATFEAAMTRFENELLPASEPLNPLCEPYVLSHGEKTESVVILLHGVSSCPRAFVDFAPLVHARGHNVMVVRMPRNGHADRATDALRHLTAEELAAFGGNVVDVASGLGEKVVFLGISAGGTVAGWAAQNRAELDRAVLVAPFYGLGGFGPRINVALMRAMLLSPDVSIWKDPVARAASEGGMAHAYKRQSTRGTAEIMRLGLATWREARDGPPAAGDIVVVTNEADTAVSNATTEVLVETWRDSGAAVTTRVFPAEHGLGHELIDPEEPGADPALTHPVILELIDAPAVAAESGPAARPAGPQ